MVDKTFKIMITVGYDNIDHSGEFIQSTEDGMYVLCDEDGTILKRPVTIWDEIYSNNGHAYEISCMEVDFEKMTIMINVERG